MAGNENINKVIFGDETLIDLTGDSVTEETLAEGETAHDASGRRIVGTMRSGQQIIEITYAEYLALSEEEKNAHVYIVTDAPNAMTVAQVNAKVEQLDARMEWKFYKSNVQTVDLSELPNDYRELLIIVNITYSNLKFYSNFYVNKAEMDGLQDAWNNILTNGYYSHDHDCYFVTLKLRKTSVIFGDSSVSGFAPTGKIMRIYYR